MSNTSSNNTKDLVNDNDSRTDIPFVICTICHERYNESSDVRAGECGHVFHYSCLQQWRLESSNCPICRKDSPRQFKLYLDFEESSASAKKQHGKNSTNNTRTTPKPEAGELDLREYENLLYEGRLYRKEIEYLTKRIADQHKLLAKKELDLANQAKRNNEMKSSIKQMQRSVMEKETLEHLVTDFINILSELNLDDEDDNSCACRGCACVGGNGNNTYNTNKDADTLNHHHVERAASFLSAHVDLGDFDFDDLAQALERQHSHQREQ